MSGLDSDWSPQSTGPCNQLVSAMTGAAELRLLGVREEVSVIYHHEGCNPMTASLSGKGTTGSLQKNNPILS